MFKSAVVYRFSKPLPLTAQQLAARLAEHPYVPPPPRQASSAGFVPPLGSAAAEAALYVHQVDGLWLFCWKQAARKVKPAEIQKRLQERVEQIEQAEHRRVYRKERQQLKDEILVQLLPNAFPEESRSRAYISPRHGLLVVEASGHNAAEQFLVALRQVLGGLPVALPVVFSDPGETMMAWLRGEEMAEGLSIGLFAEFREKQGGGRVTLTNEDPTDENAQGYRDGGYRVAALDLATDADMAGIKFRLTDELLIKSIKSDYEVDVGEGLEQESPEAKQAALLDAELTLFAGVLHTVWHDLVEAFGGYPEGQEPACWKASEVDLVDIPQPPLLKAGAVEALYDDALELVRKDGTASIARLQRQLRVGYNRAARMIDRMQEEGVVSPPDEKGARILLAVTEVPHAAV